MRAATMNVGAEIEAYETQFVVDEETGFARTENTGSRMTTTATDMEGYELNLTSHAHTIPRREGDEERGKKLEEEHDGQKIV